MLRVNTDRIIFTASAIKWSLVSVASQEEMKTNSLLKVWYLQKALKKPLGFVAEFFIF